MRKTEKEDDETEIFLKKKEVARKGRDVYIINGIKKVQNLVSKEKLNAYLEHFSYYDAIRRAEYRLAICGIRKDCSWYDSCLSDAGLVYIYSLYRCVYCGYENFWGYYHIMMRVVIIWNYYLRDDVTAICKNNNFRPVYLDSEVMLPMLRPATAHSSD